MPRAMPEIERRKPTQEEIDAIEISYAWLSKRVIKRKRGLGCWVWKGFITSQGQPQCRITVSPKVPVTMLVRRLVMKLVNGSIDPEHQTGMGGGCEWGCVHPEHILVRTKTEAMASRLGVPLSEEHKASIANSRASVHHGVIREILSSPEPSKHVSNRYGLSDGYGSKIRRRRMRVRDIDRLEQELKAELESLPRHRRKRSKLFKLSPTNPFSQLVR